MSKKVWKNCFMYFSLDGKVPKDQGCIKFCWFLRFSSLNYPNSPEYSGSDMGNFTLGKSWNTTKISWGQSLNASHLFGSKKLRKISLLVPVILTTKGRKDPRQVAPLLAEYPVSEWYYCLQNILLAWDRTRARARLFAGWEQRARGSLVASLLGMTVLYLLSFMINTKNRL